MSRMYRLLALTAAAFVSLGASLAVAEDYPSQDIHFVVGFPPGSGADTVTRFIGEKVRVISGKTVVVENKVGAAGNIAVEYVARAKPDGHTLLLSTGSSVAALMHLMKSPPVDVTKAFQIAATISRQGFVLVVDPKSPSTTVAELTEAMKKKGTTANYATAAPSGIVMGEMYKAITGVQATEVRFRSAIDSLNELASGKIDYGMLDPQMSIAQASQGRLRILAHSAGQRLEAMPNVPTMAEAGVTGMDLTGWWAVLAPSGTPRPVVDQINAWLAKILATEEARTFFAGTGGDPFISTPEQGQGLFLSDNKAWADYIRIAKIEPQ
ncbi:MAG: Bug family tripartite tricarboxylate transporter substrate binding protein [Xanthobacteraceae bacterium]